MREHAELTTVFGNGKTCESLRILLGHHSLVNLPWMLSLWVRVWQGRILHGHTTGTKVVAIKGRNEIMLCRVVAMLASVCGLIGLQRSGSVVACASHIRSGGIVVCLIHHIARNNHFIVM